MPGLLTRTSVAVGLVVNRSEPVPEPRPVADVRLAIALENPVSAYMGDFARANLADGPPEMVAPGVFAGQTLALCGAGPSLKSATIEGVDQVWACNSALGYLLDKGVKVDAAVGIDQTPGLLKEWLRAPDVTYYLASTCDTKLADHLRAFGRRIVWFHNYVAFDGEIEHYNEDWPPAFMVVEGATVVARTIGLAFWMGFERVDVYGADCAFTGEDVTHANGDTVHEAYGEHSVVMQGEVNGRIWRTRPDMLMGAVDLVRKVRKHEGRVRLLGDTLAVALLGKGDDYLDEVMRRLMPGEIPTPGD